MADLTTSGSGLRRIIETSTEIEHGRYALWVDFVNRAGIRSVAELGVWKGDFAARLLQGCPAIERYFMIDPWRHLDGWNKPFNVADDRFEVAYDEAMAKTDFAGQRRIVLRGRTTEVIDEIADHSLDFVYVDGDHTLKGISIDLIRSFGKLRPGGALGGDDLSPSIWQHGPAHEPTFVFPFVVYFAEATRSTLLALPDNQYLMIKPQEDSQGFEFVDHTGRYGDVSVRQQFLGERSARMPGSQYAVAVRRVLRWLRSFGR